jgi:hypothetical protein
VKPQKISKIIKIKINKKNKFQFILTAQQVTALIFYENNPQTFAEQKNNKKSNINRNTKNKITSSILIKKFVLIE